MKHIGLFFTLISCAHATAPLVFEPTEKNNGKKIVLIAGDEEYRSEESCPMLAKILSQRHGFHCSVVFSMSEDGTFINPNNQKSLVGLEALNDADLMIIGTRFRQLDDANYQIIADFLNAGKPVIGFRTATHAFTGPGKTGDFAWREFGPKILGEGWVAHHGQHKAEGARGIAEEENKDHPVLRGVAQPFGPSDVYTVKRVTPENATILLRGQVTKTLDPASQAVEGPKNDPMQPLAWLREYTSPNGEAKGKAFCTTMGASADFADENLRRLIVNTCYFLLDLEVPEMADVDYVDPFEATFYGFIKGDEYFQERGLQPKDYALGNSPATGLPVKKKE